MRIPRARPGAILEVPLGPWVDGINEKKEAGVLTATELRAAANVLFDEVPGQTTKRWGNMHAATMPSGTPAKYAYKYIKSDGTELMLVSDGEKLYSTADLVTFTELIATLDDTAYLSFETADGRCWITNGADDTMWYDGTNFVVMDREYGAAVVATTGAGTDQTHIVDTNLTQANDYWNLRKVVITSGAHAGMEGTVTDFDAATDKLTISGFDYDPGAGVTYQVGLVMPKGKIIRFDGNSLFIGATSENPAEIRFSRPYDPDTGEDISIDNPRAWPSTYQIAITQDDGDQVWTFSPKHRDRILVTKSSSIYRLDPDPTYIYVPSLISQEVGCRYQDSWASKDDVLYFMGNERSGLMDLYVTDMTSVRPRHKDGRLMPSFENMYRAEPIYKYISRASADQFDTGEKSTLCKTSSGRLECRELNSKSYWNEVKVSSANLSLDDPEDTLTLQGIPAWPYKYEANVLPQNASPAWTKSISGLTEDVTTTPGKLINSGTANYNTCYVKNGVYSATQNILAAFRLKHVAAGGGINSWIGIQNGVKALTVSLSNGMIYVNGLTGVDSVYSAAFNISDYKTMHLLLDKNGAASIYVDGVKYWSGAGKTAFSNIGFSDNCIFYVIVQGAFTNGAYAYMDFIYDAPNFSLTAAQMPETIPTTANIEIKLDYTRAPDKFGIMRLTLGHDFEGTTEAGTDATHIVDAALTGENDFWQARTVTITSGALAGETGTVTAYDSATHKLTISGLSGDPGDGETFEINRGGSVAIETQSSADDVTYSALAALANGAEPAVGNATPLASHLKIKLTLTRLDYVNGPEVSKLIGGFLWRMQGVLIGANITIWRGFLADSDAPAGSSLVMKIRKATTATTPIETDWGAWATITASQNIGTILGDTLPPAAGTSRWLDVKVEGGPTFAGLTPNVENIQLNWQEGSLERLLLTACVYKKRYYLAGITATSEYNDRLFVLDTQQAWTKFEGLNINRMLAFRGQVYGLSATDSKIYQMEVEGRYSDGDTPIEAYVDAGAIDGGNQRYELASLKIGSGAYISDVQVLHSYGGVTFTLLGTLNFTGEGTKVLRVPRGYIGKRHFIRLKSAAAQNMAINMAHAVLIAMPEEM
jgi:ribosomal protein L24